jgi:DNA-binding transcriptional MerR regulator/methylmalonyl-CoA mutase cobalamin-binding subunit
MDLEMIDYLKKRHPIRLVAARTGLSRDLLRAWEFSYGVVAPLRTPGGQRLYSDEDIERLRWLRLALDGGRRIGQISDLGMEDLQRLVLDDERAALEMVDPKASVPDARRWEPFLEGALAAVELLDAARLEATLKRALISLGAAELIEGVISPLMTQIGERWWKDDLGPSHEHLATVIVSRVLGEIRTTAASGADGPSLVVATPRGQRHEVGAMLAAAVAATEGWLVTYPGPNLPANSIATATRAVSARAVALSIIYPTQDPTLPDELRTLRRDLPEGVRILVGGQGASSYSEPLEEIGAIRPNSAAALAAALRFVAKSIGNGRAGH